MPSSHSTLKKVKKVVGYDVNALYLHSIMRAMPTARCDWWALNEATGRFQRKSKTLQTQLQETKEAKEVDWIRFRTVRDKVHIHSREHGQQATVGPNDYRVDGLAKNTRPMPTVYQFSGCYWHSNEKSMGCLRAYCRQHPDALAKRQYDAEELAVLEKLGFTVIQIWECKFDMIVNVAKMLINGKGVAASNPFLEEAKKYVEYLKQRPPARTFGEEKASPSYRDMFGAIMNGQVFGYAKVDIHTPDHLKAKFEDFPPIIKHADISLDDVGDFMRGICLETGNVKKPRDSLIGSYYGEKIWLMTPLLQFYKRKGLIITKMHEVAQFDPVRVFQSFGQTVTENRQKGDADPDKAILAEVYKLIRNSAYCKVLVNYFKQSDVEVVDRDRAAELQQDPHHKKTVAISDDCFEVHCRKKKITFRLPMCIGLAVYCFAKLHVLEFIYDVLFEYFDKSDYIFLESDTDSIYLSLSAENLFDLVLPEKRKEFDELVKPKWFVLDAKAQKRVPGILKVEKLADKFIGLCAKSNICVDGDKVVSVKAKGVQNRRNIEILCWDNYFRILNGEGERRAVNAGIRPVAGFGVRSYVQEKYGLSRIYVKRVCYPDGSTKPLNL